MTALLVVALAAAGGCQGCGHAPGCGGWAVVEMFQRQPPSSNVAALLAKRNRRPWCLTSESSRRFHRERKARKLIVEGASVGCLDSGAVAAAVQQLHVTQCSGVPLCLNLVKAPAKM